MVGPRLPLLVQLRLVAQALRRADLAVRARVKVDPVVRAPRRVAMLWSHLLRLVDLVVPALPRAAMHKPKVDPAVLARQRAAAVAEMRRLLLSIP